MSESDSTAYPPVTGVDVSDADAVGELLEDDAAPLTVVDTAEELEEDEDGEGRTEDPA